MLGDERHDRREELTHTHEHVIEHLECGLLLMIEDGLPELAAPPAHVPVREIVVDEGVDGGNGTPDLIGVEGLPDFGDRGLQPAEQPLFEGCRMRENAVWSQKGRSVEVRIGDEQAVDVPERQEPPLDVTSSLEAEAHRLGDGLRREHVTDHVGAHLLERIVEPDRVPPALVHLAAIGGQDPFVRQHGPIGALAFQGGGHEEQRIEPPTELPHRLDDEVGGEPALPLLAVLEVAQRRERHDAGIKPAVADLGDPAHRLRALWTADEDVVEPRPVQLRDRVHRPGVDGQLAKLPARADHSEAPASTRVEGQGQAPISLARDAPVPHVGEPVVHPELHVAGAPCHALVGGPGQ